MLDEETLGTRPGDVVLSAGLVRFNPCQGLTSVEELRKNSLRVNFDIQELLDLGFTVTGSTLKWWIEQSIEAQRAAFSPIKVQTWTLGLNEISTFIDRRHDKVWANGANFDPGMLEALYNKAKMDIPWGYNKIRCYRTINMMNVVSGDVLERLEEGNRGLIAHDPVDDAILQVRKLQTIAMCNPKLRWD
jgi:hypothetical protein